MKRLDEKRCLVTGAARGIGAAIAKAFIDEGAQVMLADINQTGVMQMAESIGGTPYTMDVGEEADWDRFAREYPAMDVVVNNAGITGLGNATGRDEEWRGVDYQYLLALWPRGYSRRGGLCGVESRHS